MLLSGQWPYIFLFLKDDDRINKVEKTKPFEGNFGNREFERSKSCKCGNLKTFLNIKRKFMLRKK